jgi:hypothetical protein
MTPERRKAKIAAYLQRLRLGDRAERLAKPIAKALRLNCLDAAGNLKPESGCAKRRDALNRLTE